MLIHPLPLRMPNNNMARKAVYLLIFTTILLLAGFCNAQTKPRPEPPATAPPLDLQPVRSSGAYAQLLLHRTELQSDLDSLLIDYTEEYPKVKDIRLELGFLKVEMDRLLAVKAADAAKLSVALGQLMLRKVELETQLDTLRTQYKDDHPDVRKTKKKVEVFEAAIKEILG
jgi:hypothetical protein